MSEKLSKEQQKELEELQKSIKSGDFRNSDANLFYSKPTWWIIC